MAVDLKELIGQMDLDSPPETIARGFHRDARNMIFLGPRGNMRGQSMPGTTKIPNPYLPATGTNKCIGAWYDSVGYQIISFNYNSGGLHGIYVFNTVTGAWQAAIQIGAGTDGDVLGFTPSPLITSVNMLYTEATDGNLLFYIDTLGRPTVFNLTKYLSAPPTLIKRSYLDLAKAPPIMPPQVTYENDDTTQINNLKNSLFQFKYRFVYSDYEKSVWSTGSIVPLPNQPFDQKVDADPSLNSRISVYLSTGDANVKSIEVSARQISNSGASDYFLIDTLDKNHLNISDNDVFRFLFKNDGVQLPIDLRDANQLFDWVPITAGAMELLNGDVPMLGNITEGRDPVKVGMNLSTFQENSGSAFNGLLFFAAQGGQNSNGNGDTLKIILTGAGDNDANGNPTTLPLSLGAVHFVIKAVDGSGNDIGFQYINSGSNVISFILDSIKTAAIAAGFTSIPSSSPNEIWLTYSSTFILQSSFNTVVGSITDDETSFAYADQGADQFGIEYFDDKGRTNGVSLAPISSITALLDNTGKTTNTFQLNITSRPPIWAAYYDVVRASQLTFNKRLFWVSNQTFQDIDLNTKVKYAFIGISYMADYNKNIESSAGVVSYGFSPGDRIQFQMRYDHNMNPNILPTGLDFEIQDVVVNPFINNAVQQGTFIKIIYPEQFISPNFNFGPSTYIINLPPPYGPTPSFDTHDFQWYKILIYNLKKHVSDETLQTFYEFSKRFGIGNAGTANAYHMGERQSQTPDLAQPAVIITQAGDYFYRTRTVPVGLMTLIQVGTARYSDEYAMLQMSVTPVANTDYTVSSTAFASRNDQAHPVYPDGNQFFYNQSATKTLTIRVQGKYHVYAEQALVHNMFLKLSNAQGSTSVYLAKNLSLSVPLTAGGGMDLEFDAYVQVPPATKVYLISQAQSYSGVATIVVTAFNINFSVVDNITIPIIESSYSDNYNIVANSNSRPTVFDENAKQINYPVLMRWGLADQLNTNINQTNKFYPENFDEIDKSYGPIQRLRARQRELRIFQERRCGRTGVYAKFIQDSGGKNLLTTTDNIITKNNIEYYVGEYGIGNQPSSLASSGFADYFVDPVKGFFLRLSMNGLEPISEQNRVQTYAGQLLPEYLNDYTYQFGGNASVLGAVFFCKDRPSEVIHCFQGGSFNGGALSNESISFREEGNAYTSKFDFAPDILLGAENDLYGFYNGDLYIFNNTTQYANYFGTSFNAAISLIFNDKVAIKKTFNGLAYQSNQIFVAPVNGDIITSEINDQTLLNQISQLIESDFYLDEGLRYAAFLRDANSQSNPVIALLEGDYLKGSYIICNLKYRGSNFAMIYAPRVSYSLSQNII